MQEQAINTFEEGLVMDLNPLTTPNNVLTNCLNGTIVTFNGNEFVLQNDMGNGRVETAYLPSGYVPVGMKEYGGIIYVASYNPLTNKGQVGSFPSPERNISSEELGSPTITLDHNSFNFTPEIEDGENVYTHDKGAKLFSTTIELLDNDILRPGDKFSIRISDKNNGSSAQSVWNYLNNLLTDKESNTTNILTLKVSIMDTNGNLIDISESLKRCLFDEPTNTFRLATKEEKEAKLGYYMEAIQYTEDIDKFKKFGDESDLFLNVYNNKVAGKLYLVAELPTIGGSSLTASGKSLKDESSVTLTTSYEMEELNIEPNFLGTRWEYTLPNGETYSEDQPYMHNKTQIYTIPNLPIKGVLKYGMLPCMKFGVLPLFEKHGYINLSLLGTGITELKSWAFYTDYQNKQTKLRFSMDSYPVEGTKISEVKLTFYNYLDWIKDGDFSNFTTKILPNKASWHGEIETTLTHDIDVKPKSMYIVVITITTDLGTTSKNNTTVEYNHIGRLLMTTSMFNDEYISRGGNTFFDEGIQKSVEFGYDANIVNNLITRKPYFPETKDLPPNIASSKIPYNGDYLVKIKYAYGLPQQTKIKNQNWYIFNNPNPEITWNNPIGTISLVNGSSISVGGAIYEPSSIEADVDKDILNISIVQHNPIKGNYENESKVTGAIITPYFKNRNMVYGYGTAASDYPNNLLYMELATRLKGAAVRLHPTMADINGSISSLGQAKEYAIGDKAADKLSPVMYNNKDGHLHGGHGDWLAITTAIKNLGFSLDYTLIPMYFEGREWGSNEGANQMSSILGISANEEIQSPYILLFWRNPNGNLYMFNAYDKFGSIARSYNDIVKGFTNILTKSPDSMGAKVYSVKDPSYLEEFVDRWEVSLSGTVEDIVNYPVSGGIYSHTTANTWVDSFTQYHSDKNLNIKREILEVKNTISISDVHITKNDKNYSVNKLISDITKLEHIGSVIQDWDNNIIPIIKNGEVIDANSIYYKTSEGVYRITSSTKPDNISDDLLTFLKGLRLVNDKLEINNSAATGIDSDITYENKYPRIAAFKGDKGGGIMLAFKTAGKYNLAGSILQDFGGNFKTFNNGISI